MQLETTKEALTDQLAAPTTRRTIVKTGIKLGYAIPLVAATYKLTGRGALAACGGDTPVAASFTFAGETVNLCCGCCDQSQTGSTQNPVLDALTACQTALAAAGQNCPIGEIGDDLRVCLAFDLGSA